MRAVLQPFQVAVVTSMVYSATWALTVTGGRLRCTALQARPGSEYELQLRWCSQSQQQSGEWLFCPLR